MRVLVGIPAAKAVSELIKNGEIRQAREQADKKVSNGAWHMVTDANFFYEYGRTVKLTDRNEKLLAKIRMYMQECSNYRPMDDIDWLVDDARYAIGQYDLEKAEKILNDALSIKNEDSYRLAEITSLKGRVAYLRGDFSLALHLHLEADSIWPNNSKTASELFDWNNLLYALKAMVADNICRANRRQITDRIIGGSGNWKIAYPGDKSRVRRLRARLINIGHLGNTIDNLLSMIATLA